LFILGAAMPAVAVIAGNEAGNVLERLDSAGGPTKYSSPVDLVFIGCVRYRLWSGSCYVDFRLSCQCSLIMTHLTGLCGPRGNPYCWPAEIPTSGRVLVNREQSMAEAEDDLLFGAGVGGADQSGNSLAHGL